MFIPLVDILRCPQAHADTWLVARIDRADDRDIREGTLGCPECLAEYPVRDGIVFFTEEAVSARYRAPSDDDAVRLAAVLDLTDPRTTAVLHGAWGGLAPLMRGIAPSQLLLLNPPVEIPVGDGVSIVRAHAAPFAPASVGAVAVDAGADDALVASLCASVRPGGRLVGPSSLAVPAGFTELARDADLWVAQADPSSPTTAPILPTRRAR